MCSRLLEIKLILLIMAWLNWLTIISVALNLFFGIEITKEILNFNMKALIKLNVLVYLLKYSDKRKR